MGCFISIVHTEKQALPFSVMSKVIRLLYDYLDLDQFENILERFGRWGSVLNIHVTLLCYYY